MNHIGDVTKMISDTPRTDQQNDDLLNSDSYTSWLEMSGFARKLERELNAANERIRLLIAERDTARRQADQTYKLREEFTELLGTDDVEQGVAVVREMKERIKRLEEALESIREYWNGDNNSRAMIDACWYAIDKASEALESKERIELLMSANADVARIAAERDAAEKRVMHLEAALRKIADQDYRGNRSTESQIALMALEVKP